MSQTRFTWLNIAEAHHDLSHRADERRRTPSTKLTKINTWYAQQLAGLIDRLKTTPDGGRRHAVRQHADALVQRAGEGQHPRPPGRPYVLAGNAGGALRTGRFLRYDGQAMPHNNLLVSSLNAMGVPDRTFGKPDWCTGPLAGPSLASEQERHMRRTFTMLPLSALALLLARAVGRGLQRRRKRAADGAAREPAVAAAAAAAAAAR